MSEAGKLSDAEARAIAGNVVDKAQRKAEDAMFGAVLLSIVLGLLNLALLVTILLVVIP